MKSCVNFGAVIPCLMILVVRTDDRAHATVKSVCLSSVRVQAVERLDSGYLFH